LLVGVACCGPAAAGGGKIGGNNSGGFGEHDLAEIRCPSIKERR
jgi:hypothetical protein